MSRNALRRLAAASPPSVRRAAARVRARGRALVTVAVVVTDYDAPFLAECLDAVTGQRRPPDEVLLLVTGDDPATASAVTAAAGGWRHRVVPLPGASPEQAGDRGLVEAAGDLVLLLGAGELLTPGALEALAGTLEESGSDVALAGAGRVSGATLETAPDAVAGRDAGPVLVRRGSPAAVTGPTPAGPFSGWARPVRALAAGGRFDVVEEPVRRGARRGTGVAFSALPPLAPWVPAWADEVEAVLRLLDGRAAAARCLVRWLLAAEAPAYLDDAERCTGAEWTRLSSLLRTLVERTTREELMSVPVEARVRAVLAAEGRRGALERFAAARWLEDGQHATRVVDGAVLAVLPVTGLEDGLLERAPAETALRTQVRRARWTEDRLVLDLVALVPGVGAEHGPATVAVELVGPDRTRRPLVAQAATDPEVDLWAGERHSGHADRTVRVTVDPHGLAAGTWCLEVSWEAAGVRRTGRVGSVEPGGSAAALPARTVGGALVALDPATATLRCGGPPAPPAAADPRPVVETLRLDGDTLLLQGLASGPVHVEVTGPATAGAGAQPRDGAFTVAVPLRHDPWGGGETALPTGRYRLPGLRLGEPLLARTPFALGSPAYRARVRRAPDDTPELLLGPPLADDEVGPAAQQRLRRWYAEDAHRLDPGAVYLQSYTGETATDSPLAIHHALRRTRPDLRLRWGVADSATRLPPGAEPVVIRSREWYAALATSAHLVTNVDMEEWFRKRPGQRLLQTFHGYPSKAMGIAAWEAKNLTPLRIERQLRRTSATWDLLLTPSPEMDVHYRTQYRYDGAIHSAGYPRDDVLVGPDAEPLRSRVRERLGIAGRTAVLYAPTWRDDLATGFRSAAMPGTFDVEAAAEALGEGFVLLLRGHRFHRQRPAATGARLLDVTGYPEVNDLVLACDAAVLDYSSLRFDLALAGRPMVFLVPDLERYGDSVRGFLYPFRDSAPGPLVGSTGDAVEELRRVAQDPERHREALEAFNRTFHRHQDGHAADRVVAAFLGSSDYARRRADRGQ